MANVITGDLEVEKKWNIGIVCSRFNEEVTEKLLDGALRKCKELGISKSATTLVSVPGAVEIPLTAQWLLENGCDGVVALGAVIRGETSHYDYVCNSVERGCSQVSLGFGAPVTFGVLTTENKAQALDRLGGNRGHKGEEAVETLVEMLSLGKKLN